VRQDAAIEMLVTGANVTTTARSIGVRRRTIERWLADPDFTGRLNSRRRAIWGSLHDRVRSLLDQALDVFGTQLVAGNFEAARDLVRVWGSAIGAGLADIGPEVGHDLEGRREVSDQIRELRSQVLRDVSPSAGRS